MLDIFDIENLITHMEFTKTKYCFNGIFEMYGFPNNIWIVKESQPEIGTEYYVSKNGMKCCIDNSSVLFSLAKKEYRERQLFHIISKLKTSDLKECAGNIIGRMSFILPNDFVVVGPDYNNKPAYYIWKNKIYSGKVGEKAFQEVIKILILGQMLYNK